MSPSQTVKKGVPKLVRAALHGSVPRGISARRLIDAPMSWHQQWRAIDLSRPN